MAKDGLLPIIIIVVIITAIALGNQFGLFAVLQCQEPTTGVAFGMNYLASTSCTSSVDFAKGTVSSSAGTSGSNFVLSSSISSNDDRTFSTFAKAEFDVDIKALNEVNLLQSSTFTHTRHCGQVGLYTISLKDDNNQVLEIGSFGKAVTVCDSGTASMGNANIKISSDKKSVTTSIVGASSKIVDTSSLVGKWRLVIKQEITTTLKDSSYSLSTTITNIERIGAVAQEVAPSIPVPPKPIVKPTSNFLSQIRTSITSLFSLFGFFSVTGSESFTTGITQTFSAERIITVDNNKNDGTFTYQYANWVLGKSDGTILTEGTWEEIPNGIYSNNFRVTLNEAGSYVLAVLVQQYTLNYNNATGQWTIINENLIFDNQPLKLTVSGTTTTTETVTPTGETTMTSDPVVASSSTPSTSHPIPIELKPEQIPEQKLVEGTSNTTLLIIAIIIVGIAVYFIFGRD